MNILPVTNTPTTGTLDHPSISDRERIKNVATLLQHMLLVLGSTYVVQTQPLYDAQPLLYGVIYLCAVGLYTTLLAITICQPPVNESVLKCLFLMLVMGTMTSIIAYLTNKWIGIGSIVIWLVAIAVVVIESKQELKKQHHQFIRPFAHKPAYIIISNLTYLLFVIAKVIFNIFTLLLGLICWIILACTKHPLNWLMSLFCPVVSVGSAVLSYSRSSYVGRRHSIPL